MFSDTWLTILVEIKKPPLELLFQNSFGRALWGGGGGGGLLLEILGGGVPPGSSNPDLISDQKNSVRHMKTSTKTTLLFLHITCGKCLD